MIISRLMVLCGIVLLAVGTASQLAFVVTTTSLPQLGFDPGPPQVIVLGVTILIFAVAVAGIDDASR